MLEVSIVIVNWNAESYLMRCLDSIFNTVDGISYEVIIVDNASSDNSVTRIKENFPAVILLENRNNLGYGKANNQGIRESKGRNILVLNPDTIVMPGSIKKLVGFIDAYKEFGAVGPKLLNTDGSIQLTCARNIPTLLTEFFWLTTLVRRFPHNRVIGGYLMSYWDHNDRREVDCLSGACIMARKEVLKGLNYFDEDFFMYGEDVDLCYRIKKAGWKIWYLPEAEIIHYGGASSKKIAETAAMYDRIAIMTFFRKHHGILSVAAYRIMCFLIGLGMTAISGTIIPFTNEREKIKKVFFENLAILEWSVGMRNK